MRSPALGFGWRKDLEVRRVVSEPDEPASDHSEIEETADSDESDLLRRRNRRWNIAELDEESAAGDRIEPDISVKPEETAEVVESEPAESECEAVSEKKETEDLQPDLLLLKSQYERANLLKQLINQEGKASFTPRINPPARGGAAQIILALLMLIGVIGAVLIGDAVWPRPAVPALAAAAFKQSLENLKPGDMVLVVLDYQPAASADIEPGVTAVFRTLQEKLSNPENYSTNWSLAG